MVITLKYKHGDYPVYARTAEEADRAYLHLFNKMNEWNYYFDLDGDQATWYHAALTGNARAAKCLLHYRSDKGYEYETIEYIYPVEP